MARRKKTGGLGDIVANVTKAAGITPCENCKERQYKLNNIFRFHRVKEMNEDQKSWFGEYLKRKSNKLEFEDRTKILEIYNDCFHSSLPDCSACTGLWIKIIKDLTKLYNYEN